jgi:hypothetical protein
MKVLAVKGFSIIAYWMLVFPSAIQGSSKNGDNSDSPLLRKRHSGRKANDQGGNDAGGEPSPEDSFYLGAILTVENISPHSRGSGWNHDLITQAIVGADNAINTNSRYHAQSSFLSKFLDIPDDGKFCPNDDEDDDDNNDNQMPLTKQREPTPKFASISWSRINYQCGRLCAPRKLEDSDHKEVAMTPLNLYLEVSNGRTPKNHKAMEAEICRALRTSGDPALQTVTECSIDYIYDSEEFVMHQGPQGGGSFGPSFAQKFVARPEEDASKSIDLARTASEHNQDNIGEDDLNPDDAFYLGAVVTLENVTPLSFLSGWNHNLIADALVNADNNINTTSNYHAQWAFIDRFADVPEGGTDCPDGNGADDDDDRLKVSGTRRPPVVGSISRSFIKYQCGRLCAPRKLQNVENEEGAVTPLNLFLGVMNGRTPENHKALEEEFCKELRKSGEPALESVTKCTIDYIYDSDDSVMRRGPPAGRTFGRSFAEKFATIMADEDESSALAKKA